MLYVLSGTHTTARKKKREALLKKSVFISIDSLQDPLAVLFREINAPTDLFGETKNIVITNASDVAGLEDFIEKNSVLLNESSSTVIIEDVTFTKDQEKVFKKINVAIETYDLPEKKEVTVFALTDALSTGSKKVAWNCYKELLQTYKVDELTGPLWWWLKGLGQTYKGVTTAKPFVQKKLSSAVMVFKDSVPEIIVSYCEATNRARTISKLEVELEDWILKSMIKN